MRFASVIGPASPERTVDDWPPINLDTVGYAHGAGRTARAARDHDERC
jgi:hypothetical protein